MKDNEKCRHCYHFTDDWQKKHGCIGNGTRLPLSGCEHYTSHILSEVESVEQMKEKHGGYWSEHPDYLVGDWKYEIANSETRQGYWEWVLGRIDADGEDIKNNNQGDLWDQDQ